MWRKTVDLLCASVWEYLKPVLISVVAIIVVTILVELLQVFYSGTTDPISIPNILHSGLEGNGINVEVRDFNGRPLDFPEVLPIFAHNGMGKLYRASHGMLLGCDPKYVHVGAHLKVRIGNLPPFDGTVKYDDMTQATYVSAPYTRDELINKINTP